MAETGHLSSTSTVETQTTSGSGRGPQFPLQLVAIPVIGLVLILSYLLIRRYQLLGF